MRAVEDAHEGRRFWFGKTSKCEVNELCIAKRPLKSSRRRCEIADGGHSTYVLQWWQSPIKYVCYFRTRVAIFGFLRQRNSKSLAYDNLNRQHRWIHWISEYYACYTTKLPFKIKHTIDIQSAIAIGDFYTYCTLPIQSFRHTTKQLSAIQITTRRSYHTWSAGRP